MYKTKDSKILHKELLSAYGKNIYKYLTLQDSLFISLYIIKNDSISIYDKLASLELTAIKILH